MSLLGRTLPSLNLPQYRASFPILISSVVYCYKELLFYCPFWKFLPVHLCLSLSALLVLAEFSLFLELFSVGVAPGSFFVPAALMPENWSSLESLSSELLTSSVNPLLSVPLKMEALGVR